MEYDFDDESLFGSPYAQQPATSAGAPKAGPQKGAKPVSLSASTRRYVANTLSASSRSKPQLFDHPAVPDSRPVTPPFTVSSLLDLSQRLSNAHPDQFPADSPFFPVNCVGIPLEFEPSPPRKSVPNVSLTWYLAQPRCKKRAQRSKVAGYTPFTHEDVLDDLDHIFGNFPSYLPPLPPVPFSQTIQPYGKKTKSSWNQAAKLKPIAEEGHSFEALSHKQISPVKKKAKKRVAFAEEKPTVLSAVKTTMAEPLASLPAGSSVDAEKENKRKLATVDPVPMEVDKKAIQGPATGKISEGSSDDSSDAAKEFCSFVELTEQCINDDGWVKMLAKEFQSGYMKTLLKKVDADIKKVCFS